MLKLFKKARSASSLLERRDRSEVDVARRMWLVYGDDNRFSKHPYFAAHREELEVYCQGKRLEWKRDPGRELEDAAEAIECSIGVVHALRYAYIEPSC